MAKDDGTPHALVGRAGLVFAYVCFAIALATFGGAAYYLPLSLKAKLFLGAAGLLLTSMFCFMAIATHLVMRPGRATGGANSEGRDKDGGVERSADAKGSHRPR